MEHYFKGKNVEHDEVLDEELSKVLPADFTWIKVKPGTKINNLMGPATAGLKDKGIILISGSGPALTKVVSCAEVVKRRCKVSHQTTKLCTRVVEEHWDPTREDLEPLKVTREIPSLQIALSKQPFETSTQQTRHSLESFLNLANTKNMSSSRPKGNKNQKSRGGKNDTKNGVSAAKELGLENKRPKRSRNKRQDKKDGGGNAKEKVHQESSNSGITDTNDGKNDKGCGEAP